MLMHRGEPRVGGDRVAGGAGGAGPGKSTLVEGAAGAAEEAGEEIRELTADRVGAEPHDGDPVAPEVPPSDGEGAKQELAGAGRTAAAEAPAEEAPPEAPPPPPPEGGGEGAADPALAGMIAQAQQDAAAGAAEAEAAAAAYRTELGARRERFEADQQATTLDKLTSMSATDKRATLAELGYDPKKIRTLKDAELDALISGKLEAEQQKAKILGMSPEELAALSPAAKQKFLVDLGIDREDLDKAGAQKTDKLFTDVVRAAHIPGTHKVKIQIKGGLFGKSWTVTVTCDADGGVDMQAKKEGGIFSKVLGWIKAALPIILTVIAPLTAGASLIALSVYQTVMAIKSGNWLGAIVGAAGALVGVGALKAVAQGTSSLAQGFQKIAAIAGKVKTVATAAQTAMTAAKAKNPGSLLGALAEGAAAFAAFASNAAGTFATTMTRWSERLRTWSAAVAGGEKVIQGIKHGDAIMAIGGAFETAAGVASAGGKTGAAKSLQRAQNLTNLVNAGRQALTRDPPDYAAVADAALGIAGQLTQDRRLDDAARLVSSANRLKQAWDARATNPQAVIEAALGLAQAIQLAKYDLEHDEDEEHDKDKDQGPLAADERQKIVERYQRATRVVQAAGRAITAATARPPDYTAALDGATQLVAELTDDKRVDAAAVVTSKLDGFTRAVRSGDPQQIAAAGFALAQAIDGLRGAIDAERDEAKRDADARLPAEHRPPSDTTAIPGLPSGPPPIASPAAPTSGGGGERVHGPNAGDELPVPTPMPAPPPPPSPRGGPRPLTAAEQRAVDAMKLAADLAAEFEHPAAKQMIAAWTKTLDELDTLIDSKDDDITAYDRVIAALHAFEAQHELITICVKELGALQQRFTDDPLKAKQLGRELQEVGRMHRAFSRLVRAAAIPQAFLEVVEDIAVIYGYDRSLSGAPATTADRLRAAADIGVHAAQLPGEVQWAVRAGRVVLEKLGLSNVAEAISIMRAAAIKAGPDVGAVLTRKLTPVLEKIAEHRLGDMALRAARALAEHITAAIPALTRASSNQAVRSAAKLLAGRLGLALRVSVSGPVAIALEIGQLELEIADELFAEIYKAGSLGLSDRLFGTAIIPLKAEIRSKPCSSHVECNAFFRYIYTSMLGGARTDVRGHWEPYLHEKLPSRVAQHLGRGFSPTRAALEAIPDVALKVLAVTEIQDVACDFLDEEFRREFGEDP